MKPKRKPQRLQKGDKVGIFVPSSPVKEPFRSEGLARVGELGYEPVEVANILGSADFLAKPSRESYEDIRRFFLDEDIKALWAARGGYGSNHLFPFLAELVLPEPKIVIGSSDVSYLLCYLADRFDMVVFYGPMAYSSLPEDRFDADNLRRVVEGDYDILRVRGSVLVRGKVNARVTGGCLSNLVSLLGTRYFPDVKGRILLLEDVGERPYRLDRMFWQLKQTGILEGVAGLLLGEFPGCFRDDVEKRNFLSRVEGYLKSSGVPVIYDLPFGHSSNICTLPLGIEVEIDTGIFPGLIIKEKGVK